MRSQQQSRLLKTDPAMIFPLTSSRMILSRPVCAGSLCFGVQVRRLGRVGRLKRTGRFGALAILMLCLLADGVAASSYRLSSWKDRLFRYPDLLESGYDGDFVRVNYKETRDVNERDEVPVHKVYSYYISRLPDKSHVTKSYSVNGRTLHYEAAGRSAGKAKAITIFLHGRGGDRSLGFNDWSFGGNFNRIKNLMVRNDGLYISPDFTDFGGRGKADIKALITEQKAKSPKAAVFVACGSMGGEICYQLLEDASAVKMLDGMLFLGTIRRDTLLYSPAFSANGHGLPIYIGHGTYDTAFSWQSQLDFFKKVKAQRPDYPIRLAIFEKGKHGTPIRMLDWRETLNWMLSLR
ncbi:alpha/beta hydrolase [uncultured Cohaesibacter sp.]|uniref:alpha/beta hydrolase family protein n=1 Tax=uncultured Cohaesibacter sp. TaxID=1002546 RepID=UPI00292DD9FD|nr:alpha/beta hydrolase [uncultured Cohaesibacter sp.]